MSSSEEITYPRLVVERTGHFSRVVTEYSPTDRRHYYPTLPGENESRDWVLIMYTDASVRRPQRGGHAACSVVWNHGGQWNGRSKVLPVAQHLGDLSDGRDLTRPPKPAVDAAEMSGIIMALETAAEMTLGTPQSFNGRMLLIWTDSEHCVDRIHERLQDLWTRPLLGMPIDMDPPDNGARPLPQRIAGEGAAAELIRHLARSGMVVDVNWLRAHQDHLDRLGNRYADHLAGSTTAIQWFGLTRQPIGSQLFWEIQRLRNNSWGVTRVESARQEVVETPVAVPAFPGIL